MWLEKIGRNIATYIRDAEISKIKNRNNGAHAREVMDRKKAITSSNDETLGVSSGVQ